MARSRARRAALQALYQWQVTGQSTSEILAQFRDTPGIRRADWSYFETLLQGVPGNLTEIDASIVPWLDRPLAQVDGVERAVLRLGAFELAHRLDVPWRVVINEAVELCHTFGAEQSHRFVNGVLDKIARRTRAAEVAQPAN